MPKVSQGAKWFDPQIVKSIRGSRSRREFATLLGVTEGAVVRWELKGKPPFGPTAALLMLIHRNPDLMLAIESFARDGRPPKCASCGSAGRAGDSVDARASNAAG